MNGVQRPAGSILSRAKPVKSLIYNYLKVVIYGQNRTGKTTLACQFLKPLLLVSFEPGQQGGSRSVSNYDGVTFLEIKRKEDAIALAKELREDKTFKTHVLDTCTSLQDVILAELMGLENVPVQLNWGSVPEGYYAARSEQAKEVMRCFIDLPANTVILAKEKDHNPPKGERNKMSRSLQTESLFAADVGAATAQWLNDACDYICQLQVINETVRTENQIEVNGQMVNDVQERETGRKVRRLRTMKDSNHEAGFRSPNPEAVPEFIIAPTPKEMHAAMIEVIAGKRTAKGVYPGSSV